ncbi:MAG: molybdopterin dinucleotide binding domain-containing protein [Candidatus Helarchaeota archaeon]
MSDDESFYSFLIPKIRLLASIVRTVSQSVVSDKSVESSEYKDALAVCYIHPQDIKNLGIKKGNIRITSEFGSVVVKAIETEKEVDEGIIILPLGPWANQISGVVNKNIKLKNFDVKLEVTNEDILDIQLIFKKNLDA